MTLSISNNESRHLTIAADTNIQTATIDGLARRIAEIQASPRSSEHSTSTSNITEIASNGFENRLQAYALTLPECPEIAPLLHWLKTLYMKIRRLLGLLPDTDTRAAINFGMLATIVRGSRNVASCPKSVLLDYVKTFYAKTNPRDPFVETLDFAFGVTRELEKLQDQDYSRSTQNTLDAIETRITSKMDLLESREKLLLPAGWFTSELVSCDGMIELMKLPDNKWNVRFLSLEENLSSSFMTRTADGKEKRTPYVDFENIDELQLKSALAPLLQMQLPAAHRNSEDTESFWGRGIAALGRMSGRNLTAEDAVFSPVELLFNCFGRVEPRIPEFSTASAMRVDSKSSIIRALFASMKAQDPAGYKEKKLQLEIQTFKDVLNDSMDLIGTTKELRDECYDACRRLTFRINKKLQQTQSALQSVADENDQEALVGRQALLEQQYESISSILQALHSYGTTRTPETATIDAWTYAPLSDAISLPQGLDPSSLAPKQFTETSTAIPEELLAPLTGKAILIGSESNVLTIQGATIALSNDLKQKIRTCHDLYNQAEYASFKQAVVAVIAQLPPPGADDFWHKACNVGLLGDRDAITPLRSDIFKLSQMLFDGQRLESPYGADASTIVAFAKLEAIHDQLGLFTTDWNQTRYLTPEYTLNLINNDNYFRSIDSVQHSESAAIAEYWKVQETFRRPERIGLIGASATEEAQMSSFAQILVYKGRNLQSLTGLQNSFIGMATDSNLSNMTQQQLWRRAYQYNMRAIETQMAEPYAKPSGEDRPLSTIRDELLSLSNPFGTTIQPLDIGFNSFVYRDYSRWAGHEELFRPDGKAISDEIDAQVVQFSLNEVNSDDGEHLTQQSVMHTDAATNIKLLRTLQSKKRCLEQTVALFMQHPEYFKDSSLHRVFDCNFFAQGVLLKKLKKTPAYGVSLAEFFKRQYELALGSGDVCQAINFLSLQNHLKGYIAIADMPLGTKEPVLRLLPTPEAFEEKFIALNLAATTEYERRLLLQTKLTYMDTCFKSGTLNHNNPEVIKQFVLDFMSMQQIPQEASKANPGADRQIQNSIIRLMPAIQHAFDNSNSIQKLFISTGVPAAEISGLQVQGTAPVFTIGKYSIDLSKGMKFCNGKAEAHMPKDAVVEQILSSIGAAESNSQCTLEFCIDGRDGTEYVIYTSLSNPDIRIIQKANQPYVVQWNKVNPNTLSGRIFNIKEWYQYTPFPENSKSDLPPAVGKILSENHAWVNINDSSSILVSDNESGELRYSIAMRKDGGKTTIDTVTRASDGLKLMNPWSTDQDVLGQLGGIEDPAHTLIWGDDRPREIVYPRLIMGDNNPLSYNVSYDAAGALKLQCQQLNRYQLKLARSGLSSDRTSTTPLAMDLLPLTFDQYHLLTSASTSDKVMLTVQELTPGSMDHQASTKAAIGPWFNRAYFDRKCADFNAQKPLLFEVDRDQRALKSDSKEGNCMLAYIFFAHKNYAAAQEYLQKSLSSLALSSRHSDIHTWIQKWPDKSPEAIAFKLKAAIHKQEAIRRHELGSTIPMEQEVIAIDNLQSLRQKYDAMQPSSLPKALQLTAKERNIYKTIEDCSLLKLAPKQATPPTPPQAPRPYNELFKRPSRTPGTAEPIATTSLWLNTGPNDNEPQNNVEFSLRSDRRFIDGFQHLYQKIYEADIGSAEFASLKQSILIASPREAIAQTLKRSLIALMVAKETNLEMSPYAWPAEWNENSFLNRFYLFRLMFVRRSASLAGLLERLNYILEAPQAENPASNESTHPLQAIATAMENRTIDQGIIMQEMLTQAFSANRSTHDHVNFHSRQQRLLGIGNQANQGEDLQAATMRLHESGALNKIRQDREEMKLEVEKQSLKTLLEVPLERSPPPSPRSVGSIAGRDTPLFGGAEAVCQDAYIIETSEMHCDAERLQFLSNHTHHSAAAAQLADELKADAEYYIQNNRSDCSYRFQNQEAINRLIEFAQQEKNALTTGAASVQSLESEIGNIISTQGRNRAQEIFNPGFTKVPDRLIGLYTEGKIQPRHLEKHLQLSVTNESAEALRNLIEQYMLKCIALKMITNVQSKLEALPKDLESITTEQANEIHAALNICRHYAIPGQYSRELLTIEFVNGYTLRKKQIDTIESMLNGESASSGQIRQMGMGEGKSSVLLPLLLKKYADGHNLATGIIPEWLIDIVSKDLDHSSSAFFGQKLTRLEFDRDTPITREWLLSKYVQFGRAITKKEALITTKSDLLSLRNRFLELLDQLTTSDEDKKAEVRESLSLLGDILWLFKSRSRVIADEVDSILNIRQELIYAIGDMVPIDPTKAHVGIDIFAHIAAEATSDESSLSQQGDLASKLLLNQQAVLLKEDVHGALCGIADHFYQQHQESLQRLIPQDLFTKYILKTTTPEENAGLGIDNETNLPRFMSVLKQDNDELYQFLCNLRAFLGDTLSHTLSGSNSVTYGRHGDGINTIPYKASNIPSEADFGDSAERIAYFCQDYLQKGITDIQVEQYIGALKNSIQSEMQERMIEGRESIFEEMDSYQRFHENYPSINLIKAFTDAAERGRLADLLNDNSQMKLNFLKNWVLPNIMVATRQATSDSLDLVDMVNEFNGFTGTPFNTDTYHDKIDSTHAKDLGTDGNSIEFLISMSQTLGTDGAPLCQVKEIDLDPENPLESIIDGCSTGNGGFFTQYRALIDAGAYMKGISNQEIGNSLGQREPTVIVDDENRKVVMDKGRITPLEERRDLEPQNRFSYYDQAHTTGTDIAQSQTAKAAVTIGEKLYIKDLFQAIWRMRRLRKGQQCDLIISTGVAKMIQARRAIASNQPVTVSEIIDFCIDNQAKPVADGNLRAEKSKIANTVPQTMFWQMVNLHRAKNGKQQFAEELYPHYEKHLLRISEENVDHLAAVTNDEDTTAVLEKLKDHSIRNFEETWNSLGDMNSDLNLVNEIQGGLAVEIAATQIRPVLAASKLPETTTAAVAASQDTEVQTQRQQQQQMNIETMTTTNYARTQVNWTRWQEASLNTLARTMEGWNQLNLAHGGFDDRIRLSANFVPVAAPSTAASIKEKMLSPTRNRVSQCVVMQNRASGEWQAALIDVLDFERVVAPLISHNKHTASIQQAYDVAVFDIRPTGKPQLLMSTEPENVLPNRWARNAEWLKFTTQAKFLGGEMNFFDQQERHVLQQWMSNTPDRTGLQRLYEQKLLLAEDTGAYANSHLRAQLIS